MKRNVFIAAIVMLSVLATGLSAQYAELKIAEIQRPFDTEEGGVGFEPKCVINNNASYTVNAKVTCRIKDLDTYEEVYEDVLSNFPCHGGNTSAEFHEFVPEGGKEYNAWFRVEAPQTGDTKDKNFTTVGYDVTPYEMVVPDWGQYPPFSPEAMFAEGLGTETPDVVLHCTIEDVWDSAYQIVLYEEALSPRTFVPYDTFDAVFPEVTDLPYAYLIRFWAEDAEGNEISHPPYAELIWFDAAEEEPLEIGFSLNTPVFLRRGGIHPVSFSIPHQTELDLVIYDAAGKFVTTLASGARAAGEHTVNWKTRNVPGGVYFLLFKTPAFKAVRKVTVIH